MRALERKLLRDLWRLKAQVVTIALVVACGVAAFVSSVSTYRSLLVSRDAYYRDSRFADVFVSLERAPEAVASRLEEIPGVASVETRLVSDVSLLFEESPEPVVGHIVSIPDVGRARLNRLHIREGRSVEPGRESEVVLSESFAKARRLRPGDTIVAVINGRKQVLRVVGIGASAEYVYVMPPGGLPDDLHYGVLWMSRRAVSAALDMEGAFDDAALALSHGASEAAVLDAVDRILEPYGSVGAYGREDQLSNQFVSDELKQNRAMAIALPTIFLAVAAFLLNVVLARLILTQRVQIGSLKAVGYGGWAIGAHYLELVAVVVTLGAVLGTALGALSGRAITRVYVDFFRFPVLAYRLDAWIPLVAWGVSLGSAVFATLGTARRVSRMPAAEAMRPESPESYRRSALDVLGLTRRLSPRLVLVLRSMTGRPFRAALTTIGVASAVAVLVAGLFVYDSVAYLIDVQFTRARPGDLSVAFLRPVPDRAVAEIGGLPGVMQAEGERDVAVRLRAGHRSYETVLRGLEADADLQRILDWSGRRVSLPPDGALVSARLAKRLDVRPGDRLRVETLEGDFSTHEVRVTGLVEDLAGLVAYMDRRALHRLLGEQPVVSSVSVTVDPALRDGMLRRLRERPLVAAVTVNESLLRSFEETMAETITIFNTVLTVFAAVIAVGVVYNAARIAFAERARDLATLRILGFTRGEASTMLLGELSVEFLVGLPLGVWLGRGLAALTAAAFSSDAFRLPVVVARETYAWSVVVVILAGIASAVAVRRMLDRFDLMSVLKAQE